MTQRRHHLVFAALVALICVLSGRTLAAWLGLSLHDEHYSQLCAIPALAAFLIYEIRSRVFVMVNFAPIAAAPLVVALLIAASATFIGGSDPSVVLTITMAAVVAASVSAFVLCYGAPAASAAAFALGFLVLAIPLPHAALQGIVHFLQWGSAAVTELLFVVFQVPHVRTDLRFDLAGQSLIIAEECSGIRSSTALLIVNALVAYYALRTPGRKLLLIAATVPLVLFKNGLRIATLGVLAVYVDPRFLTGSLHRDGGFVFFGIMLAFVALFCWLLRRSERRVPATATAAATIPEVRVSSVRP